MRGSVFLILFLFSNNVFANKNVISLESVFKTCKWALQKRSKPIRYDAERSRSIFLTKLGPSKPDLLGIREFAKMGFYPEQIYVFKGDYQPSFGLHGPEEWYRMDMAKLELRKAMHLMTMIQAHDGLFYTVHYTRFSMSEVVYAFVELYYFFKIVTKSNSIDEGADYTKVISALDDKVQMVEILKAWISNDNNQKRRNFVYDANQIIMDPEFDPEDIRSTRKFFNRLLSLFKEHYKHTNDMNHRYEEFLDELERRRMLRFVIP